MGFRLSWELLSLILLPLDVVSVIRSSAQTD